VRCTPYNIQFLEETSVDALQWELVVEVFDLLVLLEV
jgi:hypothetical protein